VAKGVATGDGCVFNARVSEDDDDGTKGLRDG